MAIITKALLLSYNLCLDLQLRYYLLIFPAFFWVALGL